MCLCVFMYFMSCILYCDVSGRLFLSLLINWLIDWLKLTIVEPVRYQSSLAGTRQVLRSGAHGAQQYAPAGCATRYPLSVKNPASWNISFSQGLLRNTIVDASCIQIKPRGELRGGGYGRQINDTTPHYITNKRITNNKILSSKSPLSLPPGLWDIYLILVTLV